MGRVHRDEGVDDPHAEHVGDGMCLRAFREHDRGRVRTHTGMLKSSKNFADTGPLPKYAREMRLVPI